MPNQMKKIVTVINNKGGVGKTTSTSIIAQLLAWLGKRVLVIDLDQQSNLSLMLNCYLEDNEDVINGLENSPEPNIYELFKYRYKTREEVLSLVKSTAVENLFIIPSSKRHRNTQLNIEMNKTGNNKIILKKVLQTIKDDFDYILIDNAPANDILTVNSMFCSDLVVVPVRMEGFSYKGLRETLDSLLYIKEEHDIDALEFGGVFVAQAETNTNVYKDLKDNYVLELGEKFLQTPIRKDIRIAEIETNFKPLLEHSPDSNCVFDYANLILELGLLEKKSENILREAIGA